MYRLRSIVNDACNMEFNDTFDSRKEIEGTLKAMLISIKIITGLDRDVISTSLTDDVTVHTINVGDGRVYTLYEIKEDGKDE